MVKLGSADLDRQRQTWAGQNNRLRIQSGLLARNTLLNLLGQVLPGLVALAAIPFIIKGLGTEAFGVFSLALVVLGYFGLFDLGLGAATTKFVAEYLGRGDTRRIAGLVWISLGLQLVLGGTGGILLASGVSLLVGKVLNVPPALLAEARTTFLLLAASLPLVLGTSALRGVLEAGQRFDLVNAVKIPALAATYVIPGIGASFGFRLPEIVAALVVARLAVALAYLMLCLRAFPFLGSSISFRFRELRPLVTYGSWIMVSNLVGPLFHYLGPLFIGILLSMTAVAYYTAPSQLLAAFWLLSGSLVPTLFPAFSSLDASSDRLAIEQLYARSLQALLLTAGPAVLIAVFLARTILLVWLGGDFAERSTVLLQILLVGSLINSLALVPHTLLRGLGRPDLTAKFHLLELPIFVGTAWFLTKEMGLVGAALSWTLWVTLNAILLFGACSLLGLAPWRALVRNGLMRTGAAVLGLGMTLSLASPFTNGNLARAFLVAVILPLFAVMAWGYGLDNAGRNFLKFEIKRLRVILCPPR